MSSASTKETLIIKLVVPEYVQNFLRGMAQLLSKQEHYSFDSVYAQENFAVENFPFHFQMLGFHYKETRRGRPR